MLKSHAWCRGQALWKYHHGEGLALESPESQDQLGRGLAASQERGLSWKTDWLIASLLPPFLSFSHSFVLSCMHSMQAPLESVL